MEDTQKIEEALAFYKEYRCFPASSNPDRVFEWLRHQQAVIAQQAAEIKELNHECEEIGRDKVRIADERAKLAFKCNEQAAEIQRVRKLYEQERALNDSIGVEREEWAKKYTEMQATTKRLLVALEWYAGHRFDDGERARQALGGNG